MNKYIIVSLLLLSFIYLSGCDKELSTSPPVKPVPIGLIFIDSNPQGAKIYEDGRNSGRITPDTLAWLDEKEYVFTLKKDLFRDTSFHVNVVNGDSHFVFIDYTKNSKMKGKILCNTNADSASIYFNDSLLQEKTPFTISNLMPGYYKIRYEKTGFREDSTLTIVESNKIADASKFLTDTTVWVDYKTNTSPIPDNAITSIAVDQENNKWIGTQYGLIKYDGNNWELFDESNSLLPSDNVTVIEINNDEVWVGTHNGVAVIKNGTWTIYDPSNAPFPMPTITGFAFEPSGKFWISTISGLVTKRENTWIRYDSTKSGIPHRWVTDVDVDAFGNVWVGTRFGLAKFAPDGTWTRYVKELVDAFIQAPFPSNFVSHVRANKDEIWISFDPDPITKIGGLVKRVGSRWETNFNPLPSHVIKGIYVEESTNRKWVATKEGLLTFTSFGNRLVYKIENSGLTTNYVSSVAFDKQNNFVWVGTIGGGFYKFKRNF